MSYWVDEFLSWGAFEFTSLRICELMSSGVVGLSWVHKPVSWLALHSSQFIEILKGQDDFNIYREIFCHPLFFSYLCNRKTAYQALQHWFRSSVGLEQQPSKLWVLGSNPNGITERGTPKTGVPLFVITPMYVFAPNNYIDSVSVKVAQTILYPREWLSRILFVLLP